MVVFDVTRSPRCGDQFTNLTFPIAAVGLGDAAQRAGRDHVDCEGGTHRGAQHSLDRLRDLLAHLLHRGVGRVRLGWERDRYLPPLTEVDGFICVGTVTVKRVTCR